MKSIMPAPAVYHERFIPPLRFVLHIGPMAFLRLSFRTSRFPCKTGCDQRRSPISFVISRLRLCLDGSKPQIAA